MMVKFRDHCCKYAAHIESPSALTFSPTRTGLSKTQREHAAEDERLDEIKEMPQQ
jgi:hypothetical protein